MTQFLPDNLLALFAPRPPIQYKPPPDDLFINRKHIQLDGIAEHVQKFEVFFVFSVLTYYLYADFKLTR